MKYEFEGPGEMVGKERPRVNMYTGRVYTPNRTKDYEFLVQQYFKLKYQNYTTIEGRIKIDIIAYLKIPKSASKKKIEEMLENNNGTKAKKTGLKNRVKTNAGTTRRQKLEKINEKDIEKEIGD